MAKKLKRTPCSLGWTDHSWRRLVNRIESKTQNTPLHRLKKKQRFISFFNSFLKENYYNKILLVDGLPF